MTARERTPLRFSRFRLRTLLIAGVVASLLFGWIGKGLYRVRQESAAIEAILQAGGQIALKPAEEHPSSQELNDRSGSTIVADQFQRAGGPQGFESFRGGVGDHDPKEAAK